MPLVIAGFELDWDWTAEDPLKGAVGPERFFHNPYYRILNARRLEHLTTLRLPLEGKRVLEVGAGIGDLTEYFLDHGCAVTTTEGRPENVEFLTRRYRRDSRVTVARLDLDDPGPDPPPRHDIVCCYGVLYHLRHPAEAMALIASLAGDLLLLETVVSPGSGDRCDLTPESTDRASQSLRGLAARPTRAWVLNRLREHLGHAYTTRSQPWHPEFPRDWSAVPPVGPAKRAVFVGSRSPISSPTMLGHLPVVHEQGAGD
ncbi:MAG: methyltransferase domain-containing protein [Phycisphaerae bacterium]|nr:methyltransferase domain-containing protein [Phycisphaerae bacterium]